MNERLADRKLDAVVVGLRHHAYYFSAHLPFWQHEGAFILWADGDSSLVAANCDASAAAAEEVLPFEAHYHYTLRQEQPHVIADLVIGALEKRGAKRTGIDTSPVTAQVLHRASGSFETIDEDLWQMRRPKDTDELALMKTAIGCTLSMHARAKEIIRPGISEIEVYNNLQAAAIEAAGEPLSAWLGNDYQCGTMGGPPRNDRPAQSGEIYILDLGPAYRGYFADNARAYPVDGTYSPRQREVAEAIAESFKRLEEIAKPGVRCMEIHETISDLLRSKTGLEFVHHLGHGVGLQPHEYPHLNPAWDDTLVEGEVFTFEPGLYSPELAAGFRIENQYLVTPDGVRNLVDIPLIP